MRSAVAFGIAAVLLTGCVDTRTAAEAPVAVSTTPSAASPASGVTPQMQVQLVAAIEDNGCVLRPETNRTIQEASGLEVGEFLFTLRALSDAGRIETIAPSTHRLISDRC